MFKSITVLTYLEGFSKTYLATAERLERRRLTIASAQRSREAKAAKNQRTASETCTGFRTRMSLSIFFFFFNNNSIN